MKRDPALSPLSHDHHQALFVAQQLRRATAGSVTEARSAFLAFWNGHGAAHFRLEEDILLPGYAPYGDPHHRLVALALCDHVEIRARAAAVAENSGISAAALNELGVRLAEHVRLEERELFPLIEAALPPDQLAALGTARAETERELDGG
ncbi:MAG TPA: hemerythrin domain-containing protein [Kofleriaceae bacterium]